MMFAPSRVVTIEKFLDVTGKGIIKFILLGSQEVTKESDRFQVDGDGSAGRSVSGALRHR